MKESSSQSLPRSHLSRRTSSHQTSQDCRPVQQTQDYHSAKLLQEHHPSKQVQDCYTIREECQDNFVPWSPKTCNSVLKMLETCGPFTCECEDDNLPGTDSSEHLIHQHTPVSRTCQDMRPCIPCPDQRPCYSQPARGSKAKTFHSSRSKQQLSDERDRERDRDKERDKDGSQKTGTTHGQAPSSKESGTTNLDRKSQPSVRSSLDRGQSEAAHPVSSKIRSFDVERGRLGLQAGGDSLPIWVTPSRTIGDVERELMEIHNVLLDTPNKKLIEAIERISDLELAVKNLMEKNNGVFEKYSEAYKQEDQMLNEKAQGAIADIQKNITDEEKRAQEAISKTNAIKNELKMLDIELKKLDDQLKLKTKATMEKPKK